AVAGISQADRLSIAGGDRGDGQREAGDAPDGCRSRHAANVTIREMTGALLAALLLQAPTGAPAAPPETAPTKTTARLEIRGGADCISRGDLTARVAARSAR